MKAKVKATGEIVDVNLMQDAMYHYGNGADEQVYYEDDLEFLSSKTKVVEGWVVREDNISFYTERPEFDEKYGNWLGGYESFVPDSFFPDLPINSPKKVRFTITLIEE